MESPKESTTQPQATRFDVGKFDETEVNRFETDVLDRESIFDEVTFAHDPQLVAMASEYRDLGLAGAEAAEVLQM